MKKILIVAFSMGIGGVEKALTGLLNTIDLKKYQVHLRLVNVSGDFLKEIPQKVIVEELTEYKQNWDLLTKPLLPQIRKKFTKGNLFSVFKLSSLYLKYKFSGHYHDLYSYTLRNSSKEKFDIAISYAGPASMLDYYVANHIEAEKKIAWVHFDIEKFYINLPSHKILYKKFDTINIVSKEAKEKFEKQFPEFKPKTQLSPNIIDSKKIYSLAKSVPLIPLPPFQGTTLLCVGRLSKEKGQDIAIKALADIRERGYDCRLVLVGGGAFIDELTSLASELKIKEKIIFIGETSNPYPYYNNCDLYLQPSLYEALCTTIEEAKLFNKPIVASDFTGIREQLENYPIYRICNANPGSVADAIIEILNQKK